MSFHDLRLAARVLRNNRLFALTAIVTIALGVGSSTAIFSVVNAVLLRPLPYANPDRLAMIQMDILGRHFMNAAIAPGNMLDLKARATAFESIAAIAAGAVPFVGMDGKPAQINYAVVTPNFFTVLGTRIRLGRNFIEADGTPEPTEAVSTTRDSPPANSPPPSPTMTILSHGFWVRRFGADSSVIGKTVQIGRAPAMIVGVAPADLRLVFSKWAGSVAEPDAYSVFRIDWSTASRLNTSLRIIGRLAPGASIATAQAQLNVFGADLQNRFPIYKGGNAVFHAEQMQPEIVQDVRPAILALMGAVLFVLLIACANVANLLLVRAMTRERELAIRAALGASRATLIGQMFAESILLAGCGAAFGLLLAKLGVTLLLRIAPVNLPRVSDVAIDPSVLGFAILVSLLSALVFGVLPAVRASRPDVAQTLRAAGRSPSLGGGKYLRQSVVLVEVALSFVLLIGSGLMVRSFMALERVDPGFDPRGVLTFTANNPRLQNTTERAAYTQTLKARLEALPGVISVTESSPLPLDGSDSNLRWGPMTAADDPSLYQSATSFFVTPGYFAAMKVKLIAGRAFTAADDDTTSRSVIVDEELAAKAFPGQRPQSVVGKQVLSRAAGPEPEPYRIIGVAQHVRHLSLATAGREQMYLSTGAGGFFPGRWAMRATGDPTRLIPAVRAVVADIDPLVPIADVLPMSVYVDRAMAATRFSLVMIGIFAAVAALLASIGLYGVLATSVRQRTAEIGVRMAFGATGGSIFRLIVGQGLALSGIGLVAGAGIALALTGVLSRAGMLVSIKPTDPLTYAVIALLFGAMATLACWIPARRAARLSPNAALRAE